LETGDTYSSTDYIMLIPPTYSEMDDVVTITSFSGTEIEKDVYYVPEFQEDDSSLSTIVKHNQTIRTYGLRYSAINKMNMPLFSIAGYEVDGKSDFIDLQEEYYIEILDGKMLFNDVEHDRKIFLNFNFDKETNEQEVKISIIYTSDNFKIESYEDEDYIPAFIPGNEYSTFVYNYENDIDNAIIYDNVHSIKVMNSGEFTIDVYAKDLQNNIFAKNCENTVNVYLPNFSISTYTNSSNSGEEHNSIGQMDKYKFKVQKQNNGKNYVNSFYLLTPEEIRLSMNNFSLARNRLLKNINKELINHIKTEMNNNIEERTKNIIKLNSNKKINKNPINNNNKNSRDNGYYFNQDLISTWKQN
jgi:hypothetical protein